MKITILISTFISLAFITSCSHADVEPNINKEVLFERFHGKYKVINCTSNIPVDLNRDGISSDNLISEINLQNSGLELRISDQFCFIQNWPEVYLSYGIPDSGINYANQGVLRLFEFDREIGQILFKPDPPSTDQQRFPMPKLVLIKPNDTIEVTVDKRLYTSSGWKIVEVKTLYERYTMTT